MKMRLLLTGIISLFVLTSCNNVNTDIFVLKGHIENAGDLKKILLYEGETVVDSVALGKDNKFKFEGTATEATLYTLIVGQQPYMLVLKNGEQVEFKTDLNNDAAQYSVSGSETSSKLQELAVIRERFQKEQTALQNEYEQRIEKGEEASAVQRELMEKSYNSIGQLSEQALQFSNENKDNLAGFYGMLFLFSIDPTTYEEQLIKYAEETKSKFPDNPFVQSFAKHMEGLKPLSIGQEAPNFTSLTPNGKAVKLSDLRGQYVLLDFWASWCAPCREENPNIVSQYHRFKNKGFTVLGVSLDKNQASWIKAIKDDKLEWTQLSDLKQWDSEAGQLYNISAIPASFLIDPDGKIIGKNLRGPALKEFLEKKLE